jgi:CheY-specific phosphatase CheX
VVNDGATQRLRAILDRYVNRAVPELFEANGVSVVSLPGDLAVESYGFAGIIGFVGDLSGTLLVGCGTELLLGCHPARGRAAEITAEMQLDWVGELANQVIGPISIRLAAHDVHLEFSPPVSVMGERMRHLGSTGQTFRAAFDSPHGKVRIWIDADMSEAVPDRKGFYEDPPEVAAPESTLIMF